MFGQGLVTHGVLPKEYSEFLVVLQDKALNRGGETDRADVHGGLWEGEE